MREILAVAGNVPADLEPGPAPMLDWIEIKRLVVDDRYQRDLKKANWTSIRRIAASFKWSRFSPVFCAPIEGGLFAIIDGQHRAHAAAICGFEKVPCQIVQMSQLEQAASFAAVNGMVTKVTSLNLFKAALSAGEDWAEDAARVAEEAGCKLMVVNASMWSKKPGEIYGPKSFRKLIDLRSRVDVVQALSLLMQAEGYRDTVDIWDMSVLHPLLLGMTATPRHLADPGFLAVLEAFDVWAAIDSIEVENRRRARLGMPKLTKKEQLRLKIEEAIVKHFGEAN